MSFWNELARAVGIQPSHNPAFERLALRIGRELSVDLTMGEQANTCYARVPCGGYKYLFAIYVVPEVGIGMSMLSRHRFPGRVNRKITQALDCRNEALKFGTWALNNEESEWYFVLRGGVDFDAFDAETVGGAIDMFLNEVNGFDESLVKNGLSPW